MRARTRRQAIGARSAVAIPVIAGAEVLAVVDLRSAERLALTDPLMRSLTGIGYELGQLLDDHRHELDMPLVTPREIEVLALAAQGLSAPQIGERLVISASTVRTHLENLYPKLGASDRAAAVAAALRLRLID
jgi:ATP/maltotriose-dependent transcriptional regulator MalT